MMRHEKQVSIIIAWINIACLLLQLSNLLRISTFEISHFPCMPPTKVSLDKFATCCMPIYISYIDNKVKWFQNNTFPKLHSIMKFSICAFFTFFKSIQSRNKQCSSSQINLFLKLKRYVEKFTRQTNNISSNLSHLASEQVLILCLLFLLGVQKVLEDRLYFLFQRPWSWMLALHLLRFWLTSPRMECPVGLHTPANIKRSWEKCCIMISRNTVK